MHQMEFCLGSVWEIEGRGGFWGKRMRGERDKSSIVLKRVSCLSVINECLSIITNYD